MKVLTTLILLALLVAPQLAQASSTSTDCAETWERYVAWIINDYRAANGLNRLYISDTLSASGEHMVQDFAKYNVFGHYLHDGTSWSQNQRNHGYTYNTWRGQVVAGGQNSPSDVVQAWKNSPPHNAVLLDPNAKVIGVGYTRRDGTKYGRYWAADFGGYGDAKGDYC